MSAPYWLDPAAPTTRFPDPVLALTEPNGLLAIGGDLSEARLLAAYRLGIFPWYNQGEPILWWSPDPRMVLFPDRLRISRSLRKTLRQNRFDVALDKDFAAVIEACAAPRDAAGGTWITPEMAAAYIALHHAGHAHSVEVRENGRLVGGLYGVSIGRMFFGESMFSRQRDASKIALARLSQQLGAWGFPAIDCQVYSTHLASLGAVEIPRATFRKILDQACGLPALPSPWRFDENVAPVHTDSS